MQIFTHLRTAVLAVAAWGCFVTAQAEVQVIKDFNFASGDTIASAGTTFTYEKIGCDVLDGAYKGLAIQGLGKFSINKNGELVNGNSGQRQVCVLDLLAGDVVTVKVAPNTTYGNPFVLVGSNGEEVTSDEENVFITNVLNDGTLAFKVGRGSYTSYIRVSRDVQGVYVAPPSINLSGVDGIKRQVTITSEVENGSIEYAIGDGSYQAYTEPFYIEATDTIHAIAYDAAGNPSEIASTEIAAGTEVQLAGVSLSADGDVITFTADQSSVLCSPEVAIIYTWTSADGSTNNNGEIASGESVTLGYGTISAYAVADGYTASDTVTTAYEAQELELVRTIDFSREAWSQTADMTVTYGETVETIKSVEYKPILFDGQQVDGFLVREVSWLKRGGYDGLYPQAGTNFAIPNVVAGQVIVVTGHYGNAAFGISLVDNGVGEADLLRTKAGSLYTFNCVEDGTLAIAMQRYGYLDKVEIYDNKLYSSSTTEPETPDTPEVDPTGITTIQQEAIGVQPIYDLQGRRVLNINRAGLYLVGGQKIFVK
jgi:hypothetical protein